MQCSSFLTDIGKSTELPASQTDVAAGIRALLPRYQPFKTRHRLSSSAAECRAGIGCANRRMRRRIVIIRRQIAGIGRGARRRGEAGRRVAAGGHALPIHDVVLLLQRLLRIRCASRVADDAEGTARGRADPGTKPGSDCCT